MEATGIGAGQRVLDVAAGTGNVAIPAALDRDLAALGDRAIQGGRREREYLLCKAPVS